MGERATWPKIEMIRIQTKIGRKLDRIVRQFEHRVPAATRSAARRAG
jgi:hypothetical protein